MVSPDRYILKILSTTDASSGMISGSPSAPLRYPEKALIVEYGLALLKSLTKSPGDILADAFGFGLCEPCVDDQIEFAVDLQCVYIPLLLSRCQSLLP